jgi:general secretion pathway protein J
MTLAELLVALTLLGMLSVMMMGGLSFGGRAWERTEEASEQVNAVVRSHAFLRARLTEGVRPGSLTGEAGRLTFASLWMGALGAGGFYEFELTRRDEALVLAWRPAPGEDGEDVEPPEELTGERVLIEGVTGLAVAFFGQPPGRPAAEWVDRWEEGWVTPRLIRVEAERADPRGIWPVLTVEVADSQQRRRL